MKRIVLVSRGGKTKVSITADEGSTIKNVTIGGYRVSDDRLDGWDVQERQGLLSSVLHVIVPWLTACAVGLAIVMLLEHCT